MFLNSYQYFRCYTTFFQILTHHKTNLKRAVGMASYQVCFCKYMYITTQSFVTQKWKGYMRENHDIIWNILLTLIKLMDYWINILVLYDSPLKLISASRLVLEIVSLLLTASIIKTSKWTSEHVISFIWKASLFWKMF